MRERGVGGDVPPDQRARSLALVAALRPVADRLGCTLAQLVLAWTAAPARVTAAIAGSRTRACPFRTQRPVTSNWMRRP